MKAQSPRINDYIKQMGNNFVYISYRLCHFILTIFFRGGFHHLHFTGEEPET